MARAAMPRAPKVERPPRGTWVKPVLLRVVAGVVGVLVVLFLYSNVVTTLIHEQRQRHLAAEFAAPSPEIPQGGAVAVLQVPSLGLNQIVIEGVDVDHLRGAPAHWRGSALPGDAGVMVVFGHRNAYGSPFEKIDRMVNGDSIVIQARNGGPIVRYVVDRVERRVQVDELQLDNTDLISYLLLVTNEDGWFDDSQTVVIARALPVTTTEAVVPDLLLDTSSAPFGLEGLVALGSLVVGVLAYGHLRHRASMVVRLVVTLPPVLFGALQLMMLADGVLPLAR